MFAPVSDENTFIGKSVRLKMAEWRPGQCGVTPPEGHASLHLHCDTTELHPSNPSVTACEYKHENGRGLSST